MSESVKRKLISKEWDHISIGLEKIRLSHFLKLLCGGRYRKVALTVFGGNTEEITICFSELYNYVELGIKHPVMRVADMKLSLIVQMENKYDNKKKN